MLSNPGSDFLSSYPGNLLTGCLCVLQFPHSYNIGNNKTQLIGQVLGSIYNLSTHFLGLIMKQKAFKQSLKTKTD